MLSRLRQIIEAAGAPTGKADPAVRLRRSVAALLVEIARADHDEKAAEEQAIASLVGRYFHLDDAAAADLLREAQAAVEDSVSLREFTAHLHEEMSDPDKQRIIAMLWDVALEDRHLDKHEDYLVGKIAELLYVTRGDVVRLRHQAAKRQEARPDARDHAL